MKTDYVAQFLVGSSTAVAAAVFNLAAARQVNWLWAAVSFAVPFLVLQMYQSSGFSPVRTWRVTHDNTQLRARLGQPSGRAAWELDAGEKRDWAVFGPYQPLGRGKYRATFRLKINSNAGDSPVAEIDVSARHGGKRLALRQLTAKDFRQADEYQDFPLDFYLLQDENEIEFRISTSGARRRLTLDSVTLSRRLI